MLFEFRLPAYLRSVGSTILKLQALHPNNKLVDEKFMFKAKQSNYLVNVWTVNEVDEMKRLIRLGVDSIITDSPDKLKQLCEKDNFYS